MLSISASFHCFGFECVNYVTKVKSSNGVGYLVESNNLILIVGLVEYCIRALEWNGIW